MSLSVNEHGGTSHRVKAGRGPPWSVETDCAQLRCCIEKLCTVKCCIALGGDKACSRFCMAALVGVVTHLVLIVASSYGDARPKPLRSVNEDTLECMLSSTDQCATATSGY